MARFPGNKKGLFRLPGKDLLTTVVALAIAYLVCGALSLLISRSSSHAPLIFVLTVLVVSRLTEGYVYGILTSIVALFGVNYVFTYPYFAFDFTLSGYPLTFCTMLAVSLITSALTTRIKQQERLQLETEKETLRANLLRAISHDLRTPLTSIIGDSAILLENRNGLTGEQERALLKEMNDEACWLIRMVENLLSVTRMAEETAIRKQPEALEELIGAATQKFRKNYPGILLHVSIPDELIFIPVDVILIEQVLTNLLENAAIHGETLTGVDLSVTLKKGKNGEKYAVFSVENDGVWIAEKLLPHLFDGYCMRGGEKEKADGGRRDMGIGLSVCAAVLKVHGGKISAENLPAGGVRFCFSLPLDGETPNVP
jgi:two-component system sensor histidine kinase KdpD